MISKWQVILPIIMVFLVVSCYPGEDELVKKDYTGEELFRGIFFLQGEVAKSLETLRPHIDRKVESEKLSPENRSFHIEFVNEIITQIKSLDPSYFNNFRSQVQSENYYSIELALANGTQMIKAAGYKSEKLSATFKLMDEIQEKQVDFGSEKIKNLDFENKEDVETFKSILRQDYAIDIDDEQYVVACAPVLAVCLFVVVVGAVAAVVNVGWVYAEAWYYGFSQSENNIAFTNSLVSEIATDF